MQNQKHYAAAISAFIIWGFFSLPLRALNAYSPGEILYFRVTFSLVVLAIIVFVFRKKSLKHNIALLVSYNKAKRYQIIFLTLLGGALLTINWLTFIHIVNNINIKTASFSYLICPVITAVLGFVLLKERITLLQWIAVGLCGLSCVLIGLHSALELGYSILTAFTYALYLITQRRNQGFDRMIILGIQVLFSFLIMSTMYSSLVHIVPTSGYFYSVIFSIAVLFTVLPLFLNLYALNKINSATIGILMYINPILNFSIAFLIFKEEVSFIQVLGYLMILVALVLFNEQNFAKVRTAILR